MLTWSKSVVALASNNSVITQGFDLEPLVDTIPISEQLQQSAIFELAHPEESVKDVWLNESPRVRKGPTLTNELITTTEKFITPTIKNIGKGWWT